MKAKSIRDTIGTAIVILLAAAAIFMGVFYPVEGARWLEQQAKTDFRLYESAQFDISNVTVSPDAYRIVNDNVPSFTEKSFNGVCFEDYSDLDELGRCGVAYACLGKETMPTEPRGEIGMIKPSGWHTVKYDCVDGKYLYNRCHLIAFCLAGENANEKNLITGTRYMNAQGMLPFEEAVANYIDETNNHVLYRVTPVFEGDNLVADGVQIEAYSVEDRGRGVQFNVFCYNTQPNIEINYTTGDSSLKGETK